MYARTTFSRRTRDTPPSSRWVSVPFRTGRIALTGAELMLGQRRNTGLATFTSSACEEREMLMPPM
jgi:hypothetical protein